MGPELRVKASYHLGILSNILEEEGGDFVKKLLSALYHTISDPESREDREFFLIERTPKSEKSWTSSGRTIRISTEDLSSSGDSSSSNDDPVNSNYSSGPDVSPPPTPINDDPVNSNYSSSPDVSPPPTPINEMPLKSLRPYVYKQVLADLNEQKSKANKMTRINWKDKSIFPKCWPNQLLPWKLTKNFCHKQPHLSQDLPFIEVLREAARQRLILTRQGSKKYLHPPDGRGKEDL